MRSYTKTAKLLLTLALLFCCTPSLRSASAQLTAASQQASALPKGVERGASVEGITEYRLANGLKVLLFPDQTKQNITVNVTYLVGSGHESYGETGMAHLLEHLVFKGTPRHPNIPNELTSHGAQANGQTTVDRTNYYETFAATDENLNWALDLEADRMVNSFIAKKDLDSEMSVVRNEFEMSENNLVRVLMDRVLSSAYLWHNYGNTTIGSRADIENVPIERLQAFYKTYYQPDNAVLIVAGKFDENKVLGLVDKYFSPIPCPTRQLPKIYTREPTQDGERTVYLRRVGDNQAILAAYHVPPGSHPDAAAVDIFTSILISAPSGRLYKALVETKMTNSVFGFTLQLNDPGVVMFNAMLSKGGSLDPARDALTETIESLSAKPPTEEEVERARASLLKNIEMTFNSSERIALQMSDWVAMGDWRLFFIHRDRLRKVTKEQVAEAAAKYLKPSNRTLGIFIPTPTPDRAEIPAVKPEDVTALVKDYNGDPAVAAGEAFDPSPANIEARLKRATLPNGMQVAMLPKETRGDAVLASLTLRFGDEKSLMNRRTAAQLAASMLTLGTTKRTRQQIQDELNRLKAQVNVTGNATQASVSIETVRENLPSVMRLVAEILRAPSFPADEFDRLKQQRIAGVESQRSDPRAIANNLYNRQTAPFQKGHVFYTSTPDELIADINATTLEDAKKFYSDFYGASNAQLAVVGDFDERQISEVVRETFGAWKSPRPFARVPNVYFDVPAINKVIETPDKANAFFIAGLNLKVRDDSHDYPALIVGNFMLGGGFLNSRLATRIRQKEGISYTVASELFVSASDEFGSFTATAIYAPQNRERLETAFREEIARVLKDGFTAQELADAKKGFLQSREVGRAQDWSLVRQLASYLFLNRTLKWDEDLERKIADLTPEQVVTALRRHIDPSKISVVKAGDFGKIASK